VVRLKILCFGALFLRKTVTETWNTCELCLTSPKNFAPGVNQWKPPKKRYFNRAQTIPERFDEEFA
jgi:hypothetical protein